LWAFLPLPGGLSEDVTVEAKAFSSTSSQLFITDHSKDRKSALWTLVTKTRTRATEREHVSDDLIFLVWIYSLREDLKIQGYEESHSGSCQQVKYRSYTSASHRGIFKCVLYQHHLGRH
jgi:hypothetical protein